MLFLRIRLFSKSQLIMVITSEPQVTKALEPRLNVTPSNEYSEFISFWIDWFDLPAVQGTLTSYPLQRSSKPHILWSSYICTHL